MAYPLPAQRKIFNRLFYTKVQALFWEGHKHFKNFSLCFDVLSNFLKRYNILSNFVAFWQYLKFIDYGYFQTFYDFIVSLFIQVFTWRIVEFTKLAKVFIATNFEPLYLEKMGQIFVSSTLRHFIRHKMSRSPLGKIFVYLP